MRISSRVIVSILTVSAASAPFALQGASAASKDWWLSLEGGIEFDDHVAVDETDANTGVSDTAVVLELDAGYKLVNEKDARVEVGYNFYQSLYSDLSAFNYQTHNPTISAWIKPGSVKLGIEYSYNHALLDDAFFLDQHMISPTASTYLSDELFLSVYYRYYDKDYNRADDERDAKTHQTGADLYYYFDKEDRGYVSAGAGYTNEDTQSLEFDYSGFMGRAAVQVPVTVFAKPARIRFSYAYQKRDYDNVESLPLAVPAATRSDDRHTLRMYGELEITDQLKATAEYRFVNRNSNLTTADYQENVGGIGLKFSF